MRANITRSWFGTAFYKKPRTLDSKKGEFSCSEHKLSVTLTALQYKPQVKMGSKIYKPLVIMSRVQYMVSKKIWCCDPGKEIETSIYEQLRENLARYFRCYWVLHSLMMLFRKLFRSPVTLSTNPSENIRERTSLILHTSRISNHLCYVRAINKK